MEILMSTITSKVLTTMMMMVVVIMMAMTTLSTKREKTRITITKSKNN